MNNENQITQAELDKMGIQIVVDYLESEDHRILSFNPEPGTDPQIIAEVNGQLGFITIRTVCYPQKAMIDEASHYQQLTFARQSSALAYFAGVSIMCTPGSSPDETFSLVKGTPYNAVFDGLNIMLTSVNVIAAELPINSNPQKLEACRAYARMINNHDITHLEPWLAVDFQADSQISMDEPLSKQEYLNYTAKKLKYIQENPAFSISAEIAYTDAFGAGPCVILTQHTPEISQFTYLFNMQNGKIIRSCMCIIPPVEQCKRTGEFPV